MTNLFRDKSTFYERLLCPSAHAFVGNRMEAHINFSVADHFASKLVGDYAEMFSRSVEACVELLCRPLFQDIHGMNEHLRLSTHIVTVPAEYQIIVSPEMPPEQIEHLGEVFLAFARHMLDGGSFRPCPEEGFGHGYLTKYKAVRTGVDASLELEVRLPHSMSIVRWGKFVERALEYLQYRTANEKPGIHWSVNETSNLISPTVASMFANVNGVSAEEMYAETEALLQRVTDTFHS